MEFRSTIKRGITIAGIFFGLSVTPVQAGIAGSITLDITNGCFSYGAGVNGATGCGNTNTGRLEYATGAFTFNNTLSGIGNPAAYTYQASISLHAEIPGNPAVFFDDTRSKSFATLADLTTDPLWGTASSFVNAVLANPSGSFTATIPPMGSFTASWNYLPNSGSIPVSATGTFEAWSSDNLNGLSQFLFGQALPPIPVNFTLNMALNAIPEPATVALMALGILGIRVTRKRMISSGSPAGSKIA